MVAVSVTLESMRRLDPDAAAALRLLGAVPPVDEDMRILVALGVRGADAGAALQHAHHTWAVIDIEAPVRVQVRAIGLF